MMIVHYFYLVSVSAAPFETDTPLVVDADTVLAGSVSSKLFQPVGRGNTQIIQGCGIVQHAQFPQRHLLDVSRKFPRDFPLENQPGFGIFDALDHAEII
jgi:hypothetical protein